MRRRAEQVAETRERIVAAAAGLFARSGARATTMKAVAHAADVSPATVGNHFATPEALLEAVVARLLDTLRMPDDTIFAGARSRAARVRALAAAMFEFYEREHHWYTLLGAELTEVPAVARAGASFARTMDALFAHALDSDDPRLARIAKGLIHPATLIALRESGLTLDEAAEVVADAIIARSRRRR